MARHIIVCRSAFTAPSADAYTITSTNVPITRWRDHALRAARPYAIDAIKQHIIATSGAAICNHSERVTFLPPIKCGPMSRIASAIETNIPADASAANQLKIRMPKGCFI